MGAFAFWLGLGGFVCIGLDWGFGLLGLFVCLFVFC